MDFNRLCILYKEISSVSVKVLLKRLRTYLKKNKNKSEPGGPIKQQYKTMKTSCLLLLAFLVAGICAQGVEGQVTGARAVGTAAGTGTGRPAGASTGGGLFGSRTGNIMAASGYFGMTFSHSSNVRFACKKIYQKHCFCTTNGADKYLNRRKFINSLAIQSKA